MAESIFPDAPKASSNEQIFGEPPPLDPRLAGMERVFKAPPLTPSLVKAIALIGPHFKLHPTEANRAIWEADQNGSCWAEFEALSDILPSMKSAGRLLEIGPGLGRSLVFFSRKLGWSDRDLHTYEGDGSTTKYTVNGPRFEDSFCGTISELRHTLAFNGIDNVIIHDAKTVALKDLPGPFDLVYGFYTIGFHWSLKHFLDDILSLLNPNGLGIFTVLNNFQPFAALEARPRYRVVSKEKV